MKLKYSVVMAVYKNDNANWIRQAVESIRSQTVQSDDIIIVCDGPVPLTISNLLLKYQRKYKEFKIIKLPNNLGAGLARNEGVKLAMHNLVAVMDADDISVPNRFELQLSKFSSDQEVALIGGQISEFYNQPQNIIGYRIVPLDYLKIKKFARRRSPINHVTIMFKKDAFIKVGGYPKLNRAEDYYMVSALIAAGYKIINISDCIVNCRVDVDNIKRRKSFNNVKQNIISRWKIYKIGTSSMYDFLISSSAQIMLFTMPSRVIDLLFKKILRKKRE